MPDLPALTLSQAHYDRVVAAFPGTTLAAKAAAYKAWLTGNLIDYAALTEARRIDEAANASKAARLAALAASLPARPGEVAQPPQQLLQTGGPSISVKDYGAEGDGTTDDTAAITAAALAAAGQTLHFPAGTYLHTGLMSRGANQTWQLEPGALLQLKDAANAHCVVVTHPGFKIAGGTIDGNRANQSLAHWYGVYVQAVADVTLDGVAIQGVKKRGIYAHDSDRLTIDRCRISDTGENAILVEATDTATAPILDPIIRNCHVDRSGEEGIIEGGIKIHGNLTSNQKVLRARITNNTVRLPTLAPSPQAQVCIEVLNLVEHAVVSGNTTVGGTMGISVARSSCAVVTGNSLGGFSYYGIEWAGSPDGTCGNNTIDGNSLGLVGIVQSLAGSHRTAITGNTVRGLALDGIVTNGGNSTTISANIITLPTGSRNAINIAGSPTGVTVSGNAIDYSGANYAIAGSLCTHLTISGNTVNGNGTCLKAVALDRSTNVTIMGNVLRGFTQHGILVYASVAFVLDHITILGNEISAPGTAVAVQATGGATVGVNVLLGQARSGLTAPAGATAQRPSAVTAGVGAQWFDKTLGKPIFSDGTAWKDAAGAAA